MKTGKIIFVNLGILIFILVFTSILSFSWQKKEQVLNEKDIISLAVDPKNQSIIYAASENYVYKTQDDGDSWKKIYNISKADKKINRLYIDPFYSDNIYVLTQDGLYQSRNQGSDWQRIFIGSSDLENNCLYITKSTKAMFLGTMQGLFISYNQGKKWQKSFEQFSDSIISSIIVNPKEENIVYLACEKGVFISEDNGKTWRRIYVVYRSEIPSEDYTDYDGEVSDQVLNIKGMTISTKNHNRFYIANSKGVFFTEDKGSSWQKLTDFGLPTLDIHSMVVIDDIELLLVATDKGIFKFNNTHWQKLDHNLLYQDFNDLTLGKDGYIWIAGKEGIYKIPFETNNGHKDNYQIDDSQITEFDINELFRGEPNIEEIQKAAIDHAEVSMNKIKQWRGQARWKALFPTLSISYDKSVYGASSGAMAVGPRDWNLDLSWDVSELVWNSDQTSIDSRSRLTVQLRQDVLDQVTHFYYERKRLKLHLLSSPPKNEEDRLYRELELQEVTANLDGLTNGYFSKILNQNER